MYSVEILVNNDTEFNAVFTFYNYEDVSKFVAIVLEQGYDVKVGFEIEENKDA